MLLIQIGQIKWEKNQSHRPADAPPQTAIHAIQRHKKYGGIHDLNQVGEQMQGDEGDAAQFIS